MLQSGLRSAKVRRASDRTQRPQNVRMGLTRGKNQKRKIKSDTYEISLPYLARSSTEEEAQIRQKFRAKITRNARHFKKVKRKPSCFSTFTIFAPDKSCVRLP